MRKLLTDGPERPVMWVKPKGRNQSAEFNVPIGGKSFWGQISATGGAVCERKPSKAEVQELTAEYVAELEQQMEFEHQAVATGGSSR